MRRTAANGGAISPQAWAKGDMVNKTRIYASGASLSGEGRTRIKGVLLRVAAPEIGGDESCLGESVLLGGFEIWGRCPRSAEVERKFDFQDKNESDDGSPRLLLDVILPLKEENLRSEFVTRYVSPVFLLLLTFCRLQKVCFSNAFITSIL